MKHFTSVSLLALLAGTTVATAGDGTQSSPYTVSEAVAQGTAGATVWVKGDLKGLGLDGASQANDPDVRADSAAVLTDGTQTLVVQSYEILQGLALEDLTATTGLTAKGHIATEGELTYLSLEELHGALTISVKHGYRGYHIASSWQAAKGMGIATVRTTYSSKADTATVGYSYQSATDSVVVVGKNSAQVIIARDGDYPVVLTSASSTISGTTSLGSGTQAGLNTVKQNNRYLYRFVATADSVGFVRNSANQKEVTLADKSEVWLVVNALDNNFYGHYQFPTDDKNWIEWTGLTPDDFAAAADGALFDFQNNNLGLPVGEGTNWADGNTDGRNIESGDVTLTTTDGTATTRVMYTASRGTTLVVYKNGTLTFTADEGRVITAIEITLQSGTMKGTTETGTLDGTMWSGSEQAVTFAFSATNYISSIAVTTADGQPTGIESVKLHAAGLRQTSDVYDLSGRRVASGSRSGLYVRGGRLVVVR